MWCLSIMKCALVVTLACVALFALGCAQGVPSSSRLKAETPICGKVTPHPTPLVLRGTAPNIDDLPWHATLYMKKGASEESPSEYQCGATIIRSNYLLTAAHCVYDESRRAILESVKFFVMSGNDGVKKHAVKQIYINPRYNGQLSNYASDIAMLELREPFEFSSKVLPACLNAECNMERILGPNAIGKVATWGRASLGASKDILQTIQLPYIPFGQCASSVGDEYAAFITDDKFCAGSNNGTALGVGDSGGGLVFEKNGQWHILGIASTSVGKGRSYSLYTKVCSYMGWIEDIISHPEK